jgi:hypothetical protein
MGEIDRVRQALYRLMFTPTEAQQLHAIIEARTIPDTTNTGGPTVAQAVEAVEQAAYEVHDPGTPDHGLRIVHVIDEYGRGSDWELDQVLRTIRVAGRARLRWNVRTDRHRLTIDRGYAGIMHVDTTNIGAMTR